VTGFIGDHGCRRKRNKDVDPKRKPALVDEILTEEFMEMGLTQGAGGMVPYPALCA
jgi:hypothetical protein